MTNSFCLSGLIEKRAELAGDIRLLEERLEQLRSDILHLDAAIRIMDPAYQVEAIVPKVRRPRREWFGIDTPCIGLATSRPSLSAVSTQRCTVERPTRKRRATEPRDWPPSSTAATTRQRRSAE
jgi:hypothetical protein